jgi:hypothetical protein
LLGGSGRALDVAEEHHDRPPFALHCSGAGGGFEPCEQLAWDQFVETRIGVFRSRALGLDSMAALHAEGCVTWVRR